jgi:spermidine/putrescine transport system ATP-binding protein
MQQELKKLQERVGITFVYVTHDQEEALTLSDRIAVMNGGRLLQEGTPQTIYERPASRFVADFIGQTNFLEGIVVEGGPTAVVRENETGTVLHCTSYEELRVGMTVSVAVRPERIYPASTMAETNVIEGRLIAAAYLGDLVQYRVTVGAMELMVQRQSDPNDEARRWSTGGVVRIAFEPNSALVLIDEERVAGEEDRRLIEVPAE